MFTPVDGAIRRVVMLVVLQSISTTTGADEVDRQIKISTLSSQPDRISGGDVLLKIYFPEAVRRESFSVLLNGKDVSTRFHVVVSNSAYIGLLSGLRLGKNKLDIVVPNGRKASTILTNYPIQGPIVSGPHIRPFVCQTENFVLADGTTLGASLDSNCSAATKITYLYKSTQTNKLTPLQNLRTLPNDVAKTTTTTGITVNFVVRVETATINRGIYESAVLHDPTTDTEPSPLFSPRAWNQVLIGVHGIGCSGGWYVQGGSEPVLKYRRSLLLDARRLGDGYAIYTNTLQNSSDSCNAFLAGETAMMGKEHFIETYGVPQYSLTIGSSGGAYTSLQIIDAFPGLFDGALISSAFPDVLSIAISAMDSHLLRHFFVNSPSTYTEGQQVSISGYNDRQAWYDAANQAGRTDPIPGRIDVIGYTSGLWNPSVPVRLRYDPMRYPNGARPTIWDAARNIYGVDQTTNFALRVFDNVGVQYGLDALNAGLISKAQFLELNRGIGGYDRDDNYVSTRTLGDEHAIAEAYSSGLHLSGSGGLAEVPILDLSGKIDETKMYHYQWFHFAIRERLIAVNGTTDNFVMWRGDSTADDSVKEQAFGLMNQWVTAIKAHPSPGPRPRTLVLHKPSSLVDGCWTKSGEFIAEQQIFSSEPHTQCNSIWPSYAFPRLVAGGSVASHILKCRLKPISLGDYRPSFDKADVQDLQRIFPAGVCDWSKPGSYFRRISVGRSYGPAPSHEIAP